MLINPKRLTPKIIQTIKLCNNRQYQKIATHSLFVDGYYNNFDIIYMIISLSDFSTITKIS